MSITNDRNQNNDLRHKLRKAEETIDVLESQMNYTLARTRIPAGRTADVFVTCFCGERIRLGPGYTVCYNIHIQYYCPNCALRCVYEPKKGKVFHRRDQDNLPE